MNTQSNTEQYIQEVFSCEKVTKIETIQKLWSDYGEIARYQIKQENCSKYIIAKTIIPSAQKVHPRGWQSDASHQRKITSYEIEAHWYREYAQSCTESHYVPHCYGLRTLSTLLPQCDSIILLSDLDESGFTSRKQRLSVEESKSCIKWLACFHAHFMQDTPVNSWPQGLWPIGSYWHLATRMDEYQAMADSPIKRAAHQLDSMLNNCRYKSLIHGDAKVANFCFSSSGERVAGVDFQYVGGGCGMKDLVYFLGSCLTEYDCLMSYQELVEYYFAELNTAMQVSTVLIDPIEVENEWRPLFYVAWADFQRFLLGWSPSHHKINNFSSEITEKGIAIAS